MLFCLSWFFFNHLRFGFLMNLSFHISFFAAYTSYLPWCLGQPRRTRRVHGRSHSIKWRSIHLLYDHYFCMSCFNSLFRRLTVSSSLIWYLARSPNVQPCPDFAYNINLILLLRGSFWSLWRYKISLFL